MYFSSLFGIFDNIFTIILQKISSSVCTIFVSSFAAHFFTLNTSAIFSILLATREISEFDFDTSALLFNRHSSDGFC